MGITRVIFWWKLTTKARAGTGSTVCTWHAQPWVHPLCLLLTQQQDQEFQFSLGYKNKIIRLKNQTAQLLARDSRAQCRQGRAAVELNHNVKK